MPRHIDRPVHLEWTASSRPSFGPASIDLDMDKFAATPETLAALFGISDPSCVKVYAKYERNIGEPKSVPTKDETSGAWILEPHQTYGVEHIDEETTTTPTFPIHKIFEQLPGDTEEAKSDVLRSISNTFYHKIWHDHETTPADFSAKFVNATSTASIQAFRQYDWLYEVFGGPEMAGEPPREDLIRAKVMAKHTSSRMTLEHSLTWLLLMHDTLQEILPDQPVLRRSMGHYWLYFYAYFPYTEDERRQLRETMLGL